MPTLTSTTLLHGDYFEQVRRMSKESVDAVITDPPYGVTRNEWDKDLDMEEFWYAVGPALKKTAAVIFFAKQPFASKLVRSAPHLFSHEIIWLKSHSTGHLNAKRIPLQQHENILVFHGLDSRLVYNPQLSVKPVEDRRPPTRGSQTPNYGAFDPKAPRTIAADTSYPRSVVYVPNVQRGIHPTQKPLELLRYLVATYTNPGDTVLDPFAGSATTLLACRELGRSSIGVEWDKEMYELASKRLQETKDAA